MKLAIIAIIGMFSAALAQNKQEKPVQQKFVNVMCKYHQRCCKKGNESRCLQQKCSQLKPLKKWKLMKAASGKRMGGPKRRF